MKDFLMELARSLGALGTFGALLWWAAS